MTRLGIQLTVDDVGADWSVLNNLRDTVVNTMKIDASLVAGPTAAGGQSRDTMETIVRSAGRSVSALWQKRSNPSSRWRSSANSGSKPPRGTFSPHPWRPRSSRHSPPSMPHPRFES